MLCSVSTDHDHTIEPMQEVCFFIKSYAEDYRKMPVLLRQYLTPCTYLRGRVAPRKRPSDESHTPCLDSILAVCGLASRASIVVLKKD